MKGVQKKWAQQAIKRLRQEPPPISDSRYQRTGELGRAWRVDGPHAQSSGIITRIVNDTDYAVYVYGDEVGDGQVAVHRGRWVTIPEAIDRDGYIDDLRQAMRDSVGS